MHQCQPVAQLNKSSQSLAAICINKALAIRTNAVIRTIPLLWTAAQEEEEYEQGLRHRQLCLGFLFMHRIKGQITRKLKPV